MSDTTDKILEFLIDSGDSLLSDIESGGMTPPPGLIEVYEEQLYNEFVSRLAEQAGVSYEEALEVLDTLVDAA